MGGQVYDAPCRARLHAVSACRNQVVAELTAILVQLSHEPVFGQQVVHLALDHDYAILNRNDKVDLIAGHILRRRELDPVRHQPPPYRCAERSILEFQCLPEWGNWCEGRHGMHWPSTAWTVDRMKHIGCGNVRGHTRLAATITPHTQRPKVLDQARVVQPQNGATPIDILDLTSGKETLPVQDGALEKRKAEPLKIDHAFEQVGMEEDVAHRTPGMSTHQGAHCFGPILFDS